MIRNITCAPLASTQNVRIRLSVFHAQVCNIACVTNYLPSSSQTVRAFPWLARFATSSYCHNALHQRPTALLLPDISSLPPCFLTSARFTTCVPLRLSLFIYEADPPLLPDISSLRNMSSSSYCHYYVHQWDQPPPFAC